MLELENMISATCVELIYFDPSFAEMAFLSPITYARKTPLTAPHARRGVLSMTCSQSLSKGKTPIFPGNVMLQFDVRVLKVPYNSSNLCLATGRQQAGIFGTGQKRRKM